MTLIRRSIVTSLVIFGVLICLLGNHYYSLYAEKTKSQNTNGSASYHPSYPPLPGDPLPVRLVEETENKNVPNDPMQFLSAANDTPAGYLAYSTDQRNSLEPDFVVWHDIGPTPTSKRDLIFHSTASKDGMAFAPYPAPNGKWLAFAFGQAFDRQEPHKIFLYNFDTKRVQPGPPEGLFDSSILWSGDSQYLAYFCGGNADGEENPDTPPLELHVYNLKSGLSTVLAKGSGITMCDWTPQDTLLYTIQPVDMSHAYNQYRGATSPRAAIIWPRIYEKSIDGGPGKLLADKALAPRVSPDSKHIAFFGWPDQPSTKADGEKNEFGLYLFDRTAKTRRLILALPSEDQDNSELRPRISWSADGAHLYIMQTELLSASPGKSVASSQDGFRISSVNIVSGELQQVTDVRPEATSSAFQSPHFSLFGVTHDNHWLVTETVETVGFTEKTGYFTLIITIGAVDLAHKTFSTIAKFKTVGGELTGVEWQSSVYH